MIVRLLLSKDWFTCINWLELKLFLILHVIQTNRCFIKSKIRDLLCIWRSFIESFNDYRISLIHDLFVIFTTFETNVCEILLITSFDAYIEVCSLRSEHQNLIIVYSFLIWIVANRLFDSDLNRYIILFQRDRNFMRSTCRTFENQQSRRVESRHSRVRVTIRLMTLSRNWAMIRKKARKKIWRWFIYSKSLSNWD